MKLISILSGNGFVMFNKELAHEVSVNGAIIFGQLCSSFESFDSKDMLTVRNGKDYFFLTSEVIEVETALTYKQQLRAIKDLEEAGYIETVIMGSPAKKYFHVTNKIIEQLIPKEEVNSDKKEDLEDEENQINQELEQSTDDFSYDKRETQAFKKDQSLPVQKLPAYKKNKEKEKSKNKKELIDNYQGITKLLNCDEFRIEMTKLTNDFYNDFALNRWNKKQWNTLVKKFVDEIIDTGRYGNIPLDKMKGYAYKSLLNMVDHNDYKNSEEFAEYQEAMQNLHTESSQSNSFLNWLEEAK
jgi:DNA-binding PadR family transcriptional regulator